MSNKTSDKNVANIEDDIKTIKNLLQMLENGFLTEEMCPIRSWDPVPKYASALAHILSDYEANKIKLQELEEERKKVLDLIFEYGQIDGGHHKMWVIDQIVRILTKDKYNEWIKNYVYDEETGDIYSWDKGIAP